VLEGRTIDPPGVTDPKHIVTEPTQTSSTQNFSSCFRHGAVGSVEGQTAGMSEHEVSGTTVAVVLAAGAGTRFRGPGHKLAATLDGRALVTISVETALRAAIGPVVVVRGDHELPGIPDGAEVVDNPRWAEGQMTSVQRGIDAAREHDAAAVVIGLADQPFVTVDAWRAVAVSDSPIAVATYDGRRGNPVRLDASVWPLLAEHGDEGARGLMRVRPELVEPVPCAGSAADIDTLEDLERWQNNS
jgi:molybdenum cofactor cytidylyltransferase